MDAFVRPNPRSPLRGYPCRAAERRSRTGFWTRCCLPAQRPLSAMRLFRAEWLGAQFCDAKNFCFTDSADAAPWSLNDNLILDSI